mgnify:CR=1 FL=1
MYIILRIGVGIGIGMEGHFPWVSGFDSLTHSLTHSLDGWMDGCFPTKATKKKKKAESRKQKAEE